MRARLPACLALAGAGVCASVFVSAFGSGARAQTGNAIAVPPPPPIMAAPPSAPAAIAPASPQPPGLVETPVPPANTDTGTPPVDNGAPETAAPAPPPATASAPPPATAMPMTNNWVPGKTAEIGVLDRVDGGIANLNIPVGGQATSGDMQISVLACMMRPADEVPDVAIFLNVQSTAANSGPPIFHGWMVRSIPAASVVGDSSETLRVANCT